MNQIRLYSDIIGGDNSHGCEINCWRNEFFVHRIHGGGRTDEREGLNSVILACNSEMVLLPMNEPVYGTKRNSQIQTYLEHNEGAGVQHLALTSEDIFRTLREMRKRSGFNGFEFMSSSLPTYYRNLKKRADDVLSGEPFKECEEIGDIGFEFMSSPPCLIIQAPNGRVMWVWNGSRGFLEGGFLQKA